MTELAANLGSIVARPRFRFFLGFAFAGVADFVPSPLVSEMLRLAPEDGFVNVAFDVRSGGPQTNMKLLP